MRTYGLISAIAALCLTVGLSAVADLESMRARVPRIIELKDQGTVGEKLDGLLGVVSSSGEAQSVVTAENADRLEVYKERAKQGSVGLETFMKVMGDERIAKEKPGRMVQDKQGNWTKKK